MKRYYLIVLISVFIVGLAASAVFALASGIPDHDTFDRSTDPGGNHNSDGYLSTSSGLSCQPDETIYMQWDLTDVGSATVQSAQLVMTVFFSSNGTSPVDLTLYQVTDDTWTETGLGYPGPVPGSIIDTVSIPTNVVSDLAITFGSAHPATSLLATYVASEAVGDKKASFAVRMSNCGSESVGASVFLYDSENGTPGDPNTVTPGTAPFLALTNPNAITLSSFRAADPSVNWLLYGGLGLLGLVAVVGTVVYRRRALARRAVAR